MPERSAPTLIVFAMSNATATRPMSGLGNFSRSAPASPLPVTMPIRAHIIWTGAMSGQVMKAVQSSVVPSWAPAIE